MRYVESTPGETPCTTPNGRHVLSEDVEAEIAMIDGPDETAKLVFAVYCSECGAQANVAAPLDEVMW